MFGRPRAHDGLARTRRVTVAGCPCAASVALMSRIRGLRAAAAMHAAGSLLRQWPAAEWRAHLDAEDGGAEASGTGGGLFHLIERATARPDVSAATRSRVAQDLRSLRADHARWRDDYLARDLPPPAREAAAHSATEDRLAVDLKEGILAEAAALGILLPEPHPGDIVSSDVGEHVVSATVGRDDDVVSTGFITLTIPVADLMRTVYTSAGAYYETSPAREDPSKLATLSSEYPERQRKAEAEADRHFAEAWVGTKDGAQRVAVELGGAVAVLAIAFPLAIMAIAGWASWEGAKKIWSWIGGGGHGFDPEWVDRAKEHSTDLLSFGVMPKAFNEADDVSPAGYAKKLASALNVVKNLDAYAGAGHLNTFRDVTASVWRYAASDIVIRDDIGVIARSLDGWPLVWAEKTTSAYDSADTSRRMAEAIGLAAAHDEGASVFLFATATAAAAEGWDNGLEPSTRVMLPRRVLFDGDDFEDGDAPAMPGGGAVAAIYAYQTARAKVRKAMGRDPSHNAPPDRTTAPTPTMDRPDPNGPPIGGGTWMPWLYGAAAAAALGGLGVVSWPLAAGAGAITWATTRWWER